MILGKRLISTGAAAEVCLTETTDIFGDSSGVALYSLDYDAIDAGGLYDGTPTDVEFGVDGQINYGARFNGSSSYIDIDNISGISGTSSSVSISAWFNFDGTSGDRFIISLRDGCLAEIGFNAGYSPRKLEFKIYDGANKTVLVDETSITNGQWHHVCLTAESGGLLTAYLDGVSQGTTSIGTISNTTQHNTIGGYNISGTVFGYFDGSIDQVRIFSKALSSDEVSTLYTETACVYDCTTDTVDFPTTNLAYYKLDNSAEDETGSYDGTETNVEYRFGRFGQAAVFGSGSRIEISSSNKPDLSTATISFWLKTTSTSTQALIGEGYSSNRWGNLQIYLDSNKLNARSGNASSAEDLPWLSTSDVNTGNWVHCVVTISGNTSKIYINGSLETTKTLTVTRAATTNPFTIGQMYANGSLFTSWVNDCQIDQVRIYSTALDSNKVSQLYNEKQCLDTVTEPTGNLRFDEFWAGYDDGQTNRAEFKLSGKGLDFNTYSEGHAVLNQDPQTSGKYYLEIKLVGTSGQDGFGVFNRSTNTDYNVSPYVSKNPIDANYGATLYSRGSIMYLGNVSQSGFTNLSLGDGDIVCMAVNVDEKRIWWGRRDGLSDNEIVWSNGNPNGGYGGLEVSFVPSDVIVTHASETSTRFSEFEVLDHADMLEPPFNFSYLDGAFTASLTENEANF